MSQERTCSGDPAKDDEPPQSSAASRSSECQQPGSSQERREEIDRMLAKVFTAQNMRKVPLLTGPSQWNQWTQAVENFLELEHFWATCDGMFEEDGDAALEAAIYCRLGPQPLSWLRQGGYETQRRETRKIMQILKERCEPSETSTAEAPSSSDSIQQTQPSDEEREGALNDFGLSTSSQ